MKPKPRTEREVTRDIVDYMQKMGYLAIRCIAGPVFSRKGGHAGAPQQSNPEGFPDWCFVHPHWFVNPRCGPRFIEVKRPGRRPAPLQLAWLERLRKDGFAAAWFDGFRAEGKKPFLGDEGD